MPVGGVPISPASVGEIGSVPQEVALCPDPTGRENRRFAVLLAFAAVLGGLATWSLRRALNGAR